MVKEAASHRSQPTGWGWRAPHPAKAWRRADHRRPRSGVKSLARRFAVGFSLVSLCTGGLVGTASVASAATSPAAACGTNGVFSTSGSSTTIDTCTYTASGSSALADTFTVPSGVTSFNVIAYGAPGGGATRNGPISGGAPVVWPRPP